MQESDHIASLSTSDSRATKSSAPRSQLSDIFDKNNINKTSVLESNNDIALGTHSDDVDGISNTSPATILSESWGPVSDSSIGLAATSVDPMDRILLSIGPATLKAAAVPTPRHVDKELEMNASEDQTVPVKHPSPTRVPFLKMLSGTMHRVDSDVEDEKSVAARSLDGSSMESILKAVGAASREAASALTPRLDDEPNQQPRDAQPSGGSKTPDSSLGIAIDRSSPRLLGKIDPQRRAYIIRVLRKSIPLVAKARRELIRKNAEYSRLCVLDAFQGRLSNGLANNSKKSKWIYMIFCIQTSDFMLNSVIFASVLHTLFIFFEPHNACLNSVLFKVMQWLIILVYAVDIALKMSYEGVQEYFRHDWQQLYVMNLVAHVMDVFLCGCTYYANPLRPVAGILRARKGRKFFDVLKKMIPGMMHSLVPLIFFVVVIMALCSISFDQFVEEFRSTAYTSYNWLFLIFTNDNFERLLPDPMVVNISYLLFFFPAIYVGQRFLLSLIIGDTYETFRSYVTKQLKKEKLKEIQGLTKAFAALDDRKCGIISDIVFRECMHCLHPEMSDEAVALYFELLAGGSQSGVNVLQFLSLRQVLAFKMNVANPNSYWTNSMKSIRKKFFDVYSTIVFPISEKFATMADTLLTYLTEKEVFDYINLFDIAVFSFDFSDQVILPQYHLPFTLCHLISWLYVIEFALRFCKHQGQLHMVSNRNNLIAILFMIGAVGAMAIALLFWAMPSMASLTISLPLFGAVSAVKFLAIFRLLRCVRMANLNEDLQDFTAAIFDIVPALVETFLLTFIVTYIFGALGNLLFGAHMEEWSTPLRAIVKAQELTFMVSYLGSMEDAMTAVHPVAVIYFVFYLVLSLTVSNIALSIIIDLHGNVLDANSKKNREKQKKKLDLVFNKIVGQARVRQLFSSANKSLNFKNVTISEFQTSDVRHFITDSREKDINLDDLKQCQKYASVDLIKFYNDQHQNHQDVNWEVNLLKSIQEAGLHREVGYSSGEVIFRDGEAADLVYILFQGTVFVSRVTKLSPLGGGRPSSGVVYDSTESALFHPTNVLGAEAMQPSGKYSYTVTAEHDTKCLVFKQSDIVHKLDPELSGSILRLAFTSHLAVETAIAETRRRRRFSTKILNPSQS